MSHNLLTTSKPVTEYGLLRTGHISISAPPKAKISDLEKAKKGDTVSAENLKKLKDHIEGQLDV